MRKIGKKDNTNILIVDNKPKNLLLLESLLDNMNCNIIKAFSENEALSLILDYDFALVLLDEQGPGMSGFETAELMRVNSKTGQVPIIFVTALDKEKNCIFKDYEIGVIDYIFKPIEPIILQSKVRVFIEFYRQKKLLQEQAVLLEVKAKELSELKKINCKLESISLCDGLTGIPNRRSFNNYIESSWKSCIRSGKPVSLIMADIDYFKAYNDNYGHPKGDECLKKVAKTMASSVKRPMDFVARYGGEEFAVILPETDSNGAIIVAKKIRKDVEALSLIHEYSQVTNYITISLGVTTVVPDQTYSMEKFICNADIALYKAKSSGRNTVSLCNDYTYNDKKSKEKYIKKFEIIAKIL